MQGTSKDIKSRNARLLREDERSWCRTFCPPLHNATMGPLQNSKIFASQRHPWARGGSPITVSTKWVCVQHLRTCFASGTLGPRLAGTLISDLRRCVLRARSCGADLEDHQTVFPTLCALNLLSQPNSEHQYLMSVAVSAWLQNVPELSLFPFVSLFVASSGGQATSMARREDV